MKKIMILAALIIGSTTTQISATPKGLQMATKEFILKQDKTFYFKSFGGIVAAAVLTSLVTKGLKFMYDKYRSKSTFEEIKKSVDDYFSGGYGWYDFFKDAVFFAVSAFLTYLTVLASKDAAIEIWTMAATEITIEK